MYLFTVNYINMETDERRSKTFEIDSQFFNSEKDVYKYAIGVAFENKKYNEVFESLEFIAGQERKL